VYALPLDLKQIGLARQSVYMQASFYAHSGRSCQPFLPRGQHPAATAVVRTGVAAV